MNKILKIVLIAGLVITLLGACLLFISLSMANWVFSALSDTKLQEFTYTEPTEAPVTDVSLDFGNSDINIRFDPDAEALTVTYPQTFSHDEKPKTEITVTEGVGSVSITEKMIWYRNLISFWDYSDPEVTLILPANRTYRLSIHTDNGAITVDTNIARDTEQNPIHDATRCRTSNVTLTTANGSITLGHDSYLYCEGEFLCRTDNGKLLLGNVDAKELTVESDNGMIQINGGNVTGRALLATANGLIHVCDTLNANDINIQTDNGKIELNTLYADKIHVESDNGSIFASGNLEATEITLTTDNGDITANVAGSRSDYTIKAETDLGESNVTSQTGGNRILNVETDTGDIEINFLSP